MANTDDVFAIQCSLNGVRRSTDKLTPKEALNFRHAALHLANYLTREYGLPGAVGGHVAEAEPKSRGRPRGHVPE